MTSQQMSPLSLKKVGNTRPSSSLWWLFTSFDKESEIDKHEFMDLAAKLSKMDCTYIVQREICPETLQEHWQGLIRFRKKQRFKSVHAMEPTWHWEKCKNINRSKAYCSKEDTRKPGRQTWATMDFDEPLRTLTTLRDWQQELYEKVLDSTDDRTVNWYWESVGNVGKSAFARYMVIKHKAYYVCGSASDMKNGLCNYYIKNQCFPKIVFLDIPRDSMGCSYKGIEQLKNGIFYNTKYEGMMIVFNPPHVVVFANGEPDDTRLSKDRWNIVEIGDPTDSKDAVLRPSTILDFV